MVATCIQMHYWITELLNYFVSFHSQVLVLTGMSVSVTKAIMAMSVNSGNAMVKTLTTQLHAVDMVRVLLPIIVSATLDGMVEIVTFPYVSANWQPLLRCVTTRMVPVPHQGRVHALLDILEVIVVFPSVMEN